MPRKERPSPLSDSIFRDKVQQQASKPHGAEHGGAGDEIPVINTFIQFGEANARSNEKSMSTAPAWIGPSLQSIMHSAAQAPVQEHAEPATLPQGVALPGAEEEPLPSQMQPQQQPVASLSELPSPKKVPVMGYSLSASSARAAGYSDGGPGAVVTVGSVSGGCSEASPSEAPTLAETARVQADREGEEDGDEDDDDDENQQQPSGIVDERALAMAEAGEIPSAGSIRHAEGQCKRCCFFPKGRCMNGHKCEFCHYEHEKRKRKKKKKSKGGGADAGSGSDGEQAAVHAAIAGLDAAGTEHLGMGPLPRTGLPLTAPPPLPPRLPGVPALPPPQDVAHLPPPPVHGAPPPNYRGQPLVAGHPAAVPLPYGYGDPYGYATDALGRPLPTAGFHDPHLWGHQPPYGVGLYESPYAPQPGAPLPPHYAAFPAVHPVADPAHYGLYAAPGALHAAHAGWPPAPPHVPPPGPPGAPVTSALTSGFAPVVGQDGRALPPPR